MQRYLLGSCLALCLAAGVPDMTYAQQGGYEAQSAENRADRDDHGNWGLLGLLGLAGLIGLKDRRRHDDVRTGPVTNR